MAARVEGQCLVEQAMSLVDELLGAVVVGKGELVVNERGGLGYQVKGAVGV